MARRVKCKRCRDSQVILLYPDCDEAGANGAVICQCVGEAVKNEIQTAISRGKQEGLEEALEVIETEQENIPVFVWSHMRSVMQAKIRALTEAKECKCKKPVVVTDNTYCFDCHLPTKHARKVRKSNEI